MPDRPNFLIGYGERLASEVVVPAAGGPKAHPYSFGEARTRLTPKIEATTREIMSQPREACPNDQAVALVTLHPTYIAKSYYPNDLLKSFGLETVGIRQSFVQAQEYREKEGPSSGMFAKFIGRGDSEPLLNMPELS